MEAFVPLRGEKVARAGYVIWLDKKVVVFYTNDLFCDVPGDLVDHTNNDAIKCVNGLVPIERWMGGESMHRTHIMAPAIVAAYNLFMNGVDRMDQIRSVNPRRRRE